MSPKKADVTSKQEKCNARTCSNDESQSRKKTDVLTSLSNEAKSDQN